jgi:hypothetical protein
MQVLWQSTLCRADRAYFTNLTLQRQPSHFNGHMLHWSQVQASYILTFTLGQFWTWFPIWTIEALTRSISFFAKGLSAINFSYFIERVTLRLVVYRQLVHLGVKPLETHDQRHFFQLNPFRDIPYISHRTRLMSSLYSIRSDRIENTASNSPSTNACVSVAADKFIEPLPSNSRLF